jgi:NAD(P)-dependent dehydrogenase (short-subunit alcohol dehydrogenase family)
MEVSWRNHPDWPFGLSPGNAKHQRDHIVARLKHKVALIAGGAGGIGSAIARRFAEEGAAVAILDVDEAAAAPLLQDIAARGFQVAFHAADVADEEQVRAAVAAALKRFGTLSVVVNSVGGAPLEDGSVTEADMAAFGKVISLDLLGTIHVCRHAVPAMRAGGGGAIVNMSSGAALRGSRTHLYSAAKGAIVSLTRSLAGAYARDNIRANAICAGRVPTERVRKKDLLTRAGDSAGRLATEDVVKTYPFWTGSPEDIANIALFLASDEARMITGASIPADGGRSAY